MYLYAACLTMQTSPRRDPEQLWLCLFCYAQPPVLWSWNTVKNRCLFFIAKPFPADRQVVGIQVCFNSARCTFFFPQLCHGCVFLQTCDCWSVTAASPSRIWFSQTWELVPSRVLLLLLLCLHSSADLRWRRLAFAWLLAAHMHRLPRRLLIRAASSSGRLKEGRAEGERRKTSGCMLLWGRRCSRYWTFKGRRCHWTWQRQWAKTPLCRYE